MKLLCINKWCYSWTSWEQSLCLALSIKMKLLEMELEEEHNVPVYQVSSTTQTEKVLQISLLISQHYSESIYLDIHIEFLSNN